MGDAGLNPPARVTGGWDDGFSSPSHITERLRAAQRWAISSQSAGLQRVSNSICATSVLPHLRMLTALRGFGSPEKAPEARRAAILDFPLLLPQAQPLGLEIYHLGHRSPESYGASPWLLRNPHTGIAAMVDSPRYSTGLRKSLEGRFGSGMVGSLPSPSPSPFPALTRVRMLAGAVHVPYTCR